MDAVHLAGAEIFDCDFFVTCDDKLNALKFYDGLSKLYPCFGVFQRMFKRPLREAQGPC